MNDDLRAEVLAKLGLTDAAPELQDTSLFHIESVAHGRFALALPELLDSEQLAKVETLRNNGETDDNIMAWVASILPEYEASMKAMILDVADDAAAHNAATE